MNRSPYVTSTIDCVPIVLAADLSCRPERRARGGTLVLNIVETLAEAKTHHDAGRLADAQHLCRQVLQLDPNHAEACYLLGAACHDAGNLAEASASLHQAARLNPLNVDAHHRLAVVLTHQGKLDEAIASFEQACRLRPQSVEISQTLRLVMAIRENIRGEALSAQERFAEAADCHRRAVELKPDYGDAYYRLGAALVQQGQFDAAVACYRRLLELEPARADAWNNLGVALGRQDKLDEAATCYRQSLKLQPDNVDALNNLGVVLVKQSKSDEAVACHRRALELKPRFAETHYNLDVALADQNVPDEAAASYRRAIELKPDYAEACHNLACVHLSQNQLEQAAANCQRAIQLKPDFADAHHSYALALLALGRFAEGWSEYEWRFKQAGKQGTLLPKPRWGGAPLAGRTILLRSEQGHGDLLQFIRYAPLIKQRGATVVVECATAIAGLVATCAGVDRVVAASQPLPSFDVYEPLLRLPGIFGTSLETIPAQVPYLWPAPESCNRWKTELEREPGLKIGIAWQGNPAHRTDRHRSIPLAHFAAIANISGIRLYSLQSGAGREQMSDVSAGWPLIDLGDQLGDFHNTAAIVRNLDLVITCDSAPAHLAGALGVPAWVALAFAADWRWMLTRADSPWYPSMRLFRQSRPGDWQSVFQTIHNELAEFLRH